MYATKIYFNGNCYSMAKPEESFEAMAIYQDRILATGSLEKMLSFRGNYTEMVDLEGFTVLPGLIDSHIHLLNYCVNLEFLSLEEATTLAEVKSLLKEKVASVSPGTWVKAIRFDQNKVKENRFLTRWELDEVTDQHPVVVCRYCMHAYMVNSKALEYAEINETNEHFFEKDNESGNFTGVIWEDAIEPILKNIPKPLTTFEERKRAVRDQLYKAASFGITGMNPSGNALCDAEEDFGVYQTLSEENDLPVRIYFSYDEMPKFGMRTGFGNNMISIGYFKSVTDGSLGSRSAALNEPYEDCQTTKGIVIYPKEEIFKNVLHAHKTGMQVAIHGIGDTGINIALDAIERAQNKYPKADPRFRIVHCNVINDDIISRLIKYNVIIDAQPIFVSSNQAWVEERLGKDRAKLTYAWKTLQDNGLIVTGSSDCPVEPFNPFLGIYSAVTRKTMDGAPEEGWMPQEKLDVFSALRMYTYNGAFSNFEENIKGTLEPGKLADFIVVNEDPFLIDPDQLKNVKVKETYLGGARVFSENSNY